MSSLTLSNMLNTLLMFESMKDIIIKEPKTLNLNLKPFITNLAANQPSWVCL